MQPAPECAPAPENPADTYAAYLAHLNRRRRGNTAYTQAAHSFLRRWPQVQQWADLPLDTRLAANSSTRPFITFLMVSGRLQPGYDYLVSRKLCSLWHELTGIFKLEETSLNQFIAVELATGNARLLQGNAAFRRQTISGNNVAGGSQPVARRSLAILWPG